MLRVSWKNWETAENYWESVTKSWDSASQFLSHFYFLFKFFFSIPNVQVIMNSSNQDSVFSLHFSVFYDLLLSFCTNDTATWDEAIFHPKLAFSPSQSCLCEDKFSIFSDLFSCLLNKFCSHSVILKKIKVSSCAQMFDYGHALSQLTLENPFFAHFGWSELSPLLSHASQLFCIVDFE